MFRIRGLQVQLWIQVELSIRRGLGAVAGVLVLEIEVRVAHSAKICRARFGSEGKASNSVSLTKSTRSFTETKISGLSSYRNCMDGVQTELLQPSVASSEKST